MKHEKHSTSFCVFLLAAIFYSGQLTDIKMALSLLLRPLAPRALARTSLCAQKTIDETLFRKYSAEPNQNLGNKNEKAEKLSESYDNLAESYDTEYDSPLYAVEDEVMLSYLPQNKDGPKTGIRTPVLDFACGTGFLLDKMHVSPTQYLGVDFSQSMLDQARKKHPNHPFQQADLGLLDSVTLQHDHISMGEWECAVALNGHLHYLDDEGLRRFVKGMHKLLKPGGSFFLMGCGPGRIRRCSQSLSANTHADFWHLRDAKTVLPFFYEHFPQTHVSARGFGLAADFGLLPTSILRHWLKFETEFITKPHFMTKYTNYIIVYGEKPTE